MNKEKIMEKFDSLITNLKNWADSSMCETCHQPNQGGEGIEHEEGCPESDQQNLEKIGTKSEKKYKYKVSDIVRSPEGRIGEIQRVNAIMRLGSNGMKPQHYDYWVYFGAAIEGGYEESELRIVNLSKEKKEEYHQTFRFGKCIIEEKKYD